MSLAEERIDRLFELAGQRASEGEMELACRYVELARKIGMKAQVSIPEKWRRKYCGECGSFLVPGRNCRVRIKSEKKLILYTCTECDNTERYGID